MVKSLYSSFSTVFKSILEAEMSESVKSIVYLRGVNQAVLGAILDFIYLGQATLYQDRMAEFLKLGRDLQIKELQEVAEEDAQIYKERDVSVQKNHEQTADETDYITRFEDNEKSNMDNEVAKLLKMDIEVANSPRISYSNSKVKAISNKNTVQKVFSDFDARCPQCGKVFTQRSSMMQHVREIHEFCKTFPCDMCQYQATRSSNLKKHKINVHKVNVINV